jgi:uroporphyrinogen-III synthase
MKQKRVLITRALHQTSELAERLRELGVEPVLIPTIEITAPSSFGPLDAAIRELAAAIRELAADGSEPAFHWLIFTSANAVEAFARRAEELGAHFISQYEAPSLGAGGETQPAMPGPKRLPRIATIGPATARALRSVGFEPDLVPPQAVAESLAEALIPYARQPDRAPTRFLLVRAEVARDHLPDTLKAAGADVIIAPAYRTVAAASSITHLRELFASPDSLPDAIAFTSSSTATNLQVLLEAAGLTLPVKVRRISIGPITSQTLRSLSLAPHAEAAEPTTSALVAAIIKMCHSKYLL